VQITTFNISLVVHGTVAENNDFEKVHRATTIITFFFLYISNYPSFYIYVGFHI